MHRKLVAGAGLKRSRPSALENMPAIIAEFGEHIGDLAPGIGSLSRLVRVSNHYKFL